MAASSHRRVVVTGLGILSPVGNDPAAFWRALLAGTSGVAPIRSLDAAGLPVRIAGELKNFDVKKVLTGKEERKSLKMMARTVQLGVAGSKLAYDDAGLDRSRPDPARFGVEIGSSL